MRWVVSPQVFDQLVEALDRPAHVVEPLARLAEKTFPADPVCPECLQGKHGNCDGTALDEEHDEITLCACNEAGHGDS